jgi:REP element-mobilizing transposase RayT
MRYRANEHLPYFCTITVLDWLPVLIESRYIDPILDSLKFSRERKGLELFAFVIMPNHLHAICAAPDLQTIMRDFKRFTSREIHERLKSDRRETTLHWLKWATQRARRERGELSLWEDGFRPQALWTRDVFEQKLQYVHDNPARKGLVSIPEEWWHSSAGFLAGRPAFCMAVDRLEL